MWFRKTRWDCFTDDEIGDLSFREVIRNYASGEFQDGDLVRPVGTTHWHRIETVEEIVTAVELFRRRQVWQSRLFRIDGRSLGKSNRPGCLVLMGGLLSLSAAGLIRLLAHDETHPPDCQQCHAEASLDDDRMSHRLQSSESQWQTQRGEWQVKMFTDEGS